MKNIVIIFLLFIFLVSIALSHGKNFFEFAPDVSDELAISDVDTPAQSFLALNDFLDGFDLWIANRVSAGTATFELRGDQNLLLASKNVTIPVISEKFGGTRFHVDFPAKISVSNKKLYKIRIISASPDFKLYKASQVQIFQHNTQTYPDYQVESALLGSKEQNFAFKYALYEAQEAIPPKITNASSTILSPASVEISFNANEAVDFRADFGPVGQGNTGGTVYRGRYELCPESGKRCLLTIGVSANTSYHYDLFAKDEWGNESKVSGNFTTPQSGTPPPPPPPRPPPPGSGPPPPLGPPPPAGPPPPGAGPPPPGGPAPPPPGTPPPPAGGGPPGPPPPGRPAPPAPPPPSGPPPERGLGGSKTYTNNSKTVKITVNPGADDTPDKNSIVIEWSPPTEKQKAQGFVVRIFDKVKKETKEIAVSGEIRKLVVERIAEGRYRITIFANIDGTLEQIGEPVEIEIRLREITVFTTTQILSVILITIGFISGLLIILRKI